MRPLIKVGLLTFSMLFFTSQSMAQGTSIGLKGGGTLYQGVIEFMNVEETADAVFAFGGGLFMEMPLNRFVSVQPELLFMMKATEINDLFGIGGSYNNTFSYIDVPFLLRVNIDVLDGLTPYVMGGPFAGYLLKAESEYGGSTEDITDDFESINFGAKIGGGFQFGALSLEVMYEMGLMNILDEDEGGELSAKLNGLSLMLGISF
ncbi:MAG: porin family protein [Balneolaceae bacterium]